MLENFMGKVPQEEIIHPEIEKDELNLGNKTPTETEAAKELIQELKAKNYSEDQIKEALEKLD
ncbi:MAG: hypothetical protein NDI62_02900 [Burkholderiales bacterium]|nr:hypothetical protein [Burkholderiales bacterium]